jgi:aminoglycoside phosphotransferase (APT) family kinase protein
MTTEPTLVQSGSPPGLDVDALADYFEAARPGLVRRPLAAALITGGRSNLTYQVLGADGRELIVRRPPLGHVLATAHDMAREHRIITALRNTAVPVPHPLVLCTDPDVLGAPFFVMDKVPGVVLRERVDLEGLGVERVQRICQRMLGTLASLHAIDPVRAGLEDFGRTKGYLRRQVNRWRRQLDQSHTRDLPGLNELYQRLADAVPVESRSAIVHGDYRLDNLLVGGGDQITAVLDWEMSTLGDPLVDIAVLVAYAQEATQSPYGNPDSAANAAGFPSPDELLETYARLSGCAAERLGFYLGLAFFKIAGILEGIHFRYVAGQTVGDGFDGVGVRVPWLIQAGLNAITC